MSIIRRIRPVCTDFILEHVATRDDPDYRRKVIMINVVTVVAILTLVFLGFIGHLQGNPLLGYLDHIMAAVLTVLLVFLYRSGQYEVAARTGIFLMGLFFVYLFVTGGEDGTGHLWYYTFPLFASFLLGWREGLWAAVLILIPASIFLLVQNRLPSSWHVYQWGFAFRFIPSFLVVTAYSYTFERLREKGFSESQLKTMALEQANAELRKEVIERKQAEQRLEHARRVAEKANQAKSEFLSNMSHELRTPLNHIIGFTELVVDRNFGDLNPTQEEYLNDVLDSSHHLLSLVNDILDLSKVESGKQELLREPVDLRQLLEESLNIIRENAQKNQIDVRFRIDALPEAFSADPRRIKQILYNLLSNAVKFTPEGGWIEVTAGLAGSGDTLGDAVQIGVSDSGIGIEPEDMDRIFNPFEQVDNSSSRRYPGTGLGLSLTKQLVESHGGRIRAESPGRHQGSRFLFTLPIRCVDGTRPACGR